MYDLELGKIAEKIKQENANRVLIQLPDGLKPRAEEITDYLEKNTGSEIFIWFSDCFGACDVPLGLDSLKIDLLIQFGHTKFNKTKW